MHTGIKYAILHRVRKAYCKNKLFGIKWANCLSDATLFQSHFQAYKALDKINKDKFCVIVRVRLIAE